MTKENAKVYEAYSNGIADQGEIAAGLIEGAGGAIKNAVEKTVANAVELLKISADVQAPLQHAEESKNIAMHNALNNKQMALPDAPRPVSDTGKALASGTLTPGQLVYNIGGNLATVGLKSVMESIVDYSYGNISSTELGGDLTSWGGPTLLAAAGGKMFKAPQNVGHTVENTKALKPAGLGISSSEAQRIQNFANRTGVGVNVVGSRASGTERPASDFDYILDLPGGGNHRIRHSAESSLPRGTAGGSLNSRGQETGIDVLRTTLDPKLPHIQFTPKLEK